MARFITRCISTKRARPQRAEHVSADLQRLPIFSVRSAIRTAPAGKPENPPPFGVSRWSRYSRKLVRIASKSTYEQAHLSKSPLTTRPRRRGGGGGGACGCERGGWAPRPCAKIVWPPRPRPLSKYVVMALPAGSASLCEAEGLKPHGRANMKWRQDTRSNHGYRRISRTPLTHAAEPDGSTYTTRPRI